MATVLVKTTKCDICQADGAGTFFFQMPDDGKWEVDLCGRHSAPFTNLLEQARPGKPRRSRKGDGIMVEKPKPRGRPRKAVASKG